MKKKIPIGIDDFKKLIDENYYFIDKSDFIEEVINDSQVSLITRPRRFGKTLNMSMLKYFFDEKEENNYLFENLNVSKNKSMMNHCGKYPVIFLSFRGCSGENLKDTKRLIAEEILREVRRFDYLRENLDKIYKKKLDEIILLDDNAIIIKSIYILTELIFISSGKKAIVLIDEYDNPINNSYNKCFYKEFMNFIRPFYENTLKSNVYIQKAVLTGILRISKESIFSGLNNMVINTIFNNRYSDKFGFLENEVENILNYYNIDYKMSEVKDYYNGYLIGTSEIFNPWSIINYTDFMITNKGYSKDFWINTSSNDIIKNLMKFDSIRHKKDIENLINQKSIIKTIDENVSFDYLKNKTDAPWSLMLFSGYLKVVRQIDRRRFELKIPNKEITNIYKDLIVDWLDSFEFVGYENIITYLLKGDTYSFEEGFKEIIFDSMSFFDPSGSKPENFYHGFVLGLLALLIDTYDINYNIKSNRETGKGRADIIIIPKNKRDIGIIMEFKKSSTEKDLLVDSKNALDQINTNNYQRELQNFDVDNIIKVGISFCGKECEITFG